MRIDDDELKRFCIAWVRSKNNATEAIKKIRPERNYTTGSSFVMGHRVLMTAKRHPQFAEWCAMGAEPKPVAKSKPAALPTASVTPPPHELERVKVADQETRRRQRLAEFLSVPIGEIPELERAGMPEWMQDRLASFRGVAPARPPKPPLAVTYEGAEACARWREKNERKFRGWTFVTPVLPNQNKEN